MWKLVPRGMIVSAMSSDTPIPLADFTLAGIDAANLSRIEQGKYSVGLDILSRIAFVLGAHIDLVPNQL